jgi:hypothetical protein
MGSDLAHVQSGEHPAVTGLGLAPQALTQCRRAGRPLAVCGAAVGIIDRHGGCLPLPIIGWRLLRKKLLQHPRHLLAGLLKRPFCQTRSGRLIELGLVKAAVGPLPRQGLRLRDGLGQRHAAAHRQVHVVDGRASGLRGGLAPKAQLKRHRGEPSPTDRIEVAQAYGQRADAVVARGAKHEAAQLVLLLPNAYIEPPIGLAVALPSDLAQVWRGAVQALQARLGHAAAGLAVARAQQPPAHAVKEAVVRPQVEVGVVEEQAHRDLAQFARGGLGAQRLIERVVDPAVSALDLAGEGEAIVFFWQPLAVLLNHAANRYAPNDGRRQTQSFEHDRGPL